MSRRSRAGGETVKTRRKAAARKHANAPRVAVGLGPPAGQETEVARLTRELHEGREQQRATSEILGVVARSGTNVQSVLDTVCQSAAQLCEAHDASIWRPDGERLRLTAHHGPISQIESIPLVRESVVGRSVLDMRSIHILNLQTQEDEFPVTSKIARRLGFRTGLFVPLMREGVAIGVIALRRAEAQLFTERQVALLQTFANQAVIAIENARLLNELRASLDRQTATSEVLRLISTSGGQLSPVFDAVLENATRLSGANFGNLYLYHDDAYHAVSAYNAPLAFEDFLRRGPIRPPPDTPLAQLVHDPRPIQLEDVRALSAYATRNPFVVAGAELGGVRTIFVVPMLKEGVLIGAIVIYRREVQTFSEKQVELVQNFAAQAVIAIENARLLNELRESLQQQTATAEILRVISSSPGELEPVFQNLLGNARRLCAADFGLMFQYDGSSFQLMRSSAPIRTLSGTCNADLSVRVPNH
jgi:GAF domain-containing protein